MNAIVNTAPGLLEWRDWPTPNLGPGQVRIRTAACSICATDLEMIAGWKRTTFPAVPGHEWSGRVDAVGPDVSRELLGRACVAENVMRDGGEVGFEHPGGYAQCFLTEAANVRTLPADFPMHVAALIEPLAVAVRGFKRLGELRAGRTLIFGDGPIGLLLTLLLRESGVRDVAVVGGHENRLHLAQEYGARRVCNYHQLPGGLEEGVASALGGDYPVIIEAAGSADALECALTLAAKDARILILGGYGEATAHFPWWTRLQIPELHLIGSNASAGAWDEAVEKAVGLRAELERMITHRFPAERFADAFALVRQKRSDALKVVLEWKA
jgi:2-desacetyl-2-hydroxyethyl bacteriochlorophyllide A dehydrogenase